MPQIAQKRMNKRDGVEKVSLLHFNSKRLILTVKDLSVKI